MKMLDLHNKRVSIYGFGREGQATLKAILSNQPGRKINILNDSILAEELIAPYCTIGELNFFYGEKIKEGLQESDVLIKSPGISLYRPEIVAAKKDGLVITSSTNLAFANIDRQKLIAISGTKGKSTTSSIITHLLRGLGASVELAGNIGTPLVEWFSLQFEPDFYVAELSSYQIADLQVYPSIALILNLYKEHEDWHGSEEQYYKDKIRLSSACAKHTIVNSSDFNTNQHKDLLYNPYWFNSTTSIHVKGEFFYDQDRQLFSTKCCPLLGEHNLINICAALTLIKILGFNLKDCESLIKSFKGLPHRLMILGERDGITYVDDSISTVPQATLAALNCFNTNSLTLLLGGCDRGQDWRSFSMEISKFLPHAIIVMPDNGEQIEKVFRESMEQTQISATKIINSSSLEEAVKIAGQITPRGGVVLLSPASASYGRFANFEVRGKMFKKFAGFEG